MTDFELHKMPNGTAVFYRDADHSYWPAKEDGSRGRRCLGVTTPVKCFDGSPDGLLRWAARTGYIGIAELAAPIVSLGSDPDQIVAELSWLTSQDSIIRRLNESGLDFESVRDQAGEKGSNVHEKALQAMAMGKPVPDLDSMTDAERGLSQAVMRFFLEHEPEVDLVEQVVYSGRLGAAGRLDLFATLPKLGGEKFVIDAKTGKWVFEAAHVQVGGGYPCLLRDAGFVGEDELPRGLILKLHEDGTYRLIDAQGTPAEFELAVLVHKARNRIKREAKNAHDRATVDRKLAAEIDEAIKAHEAKS